MKFDTTMKNVLQILQMELQVLCSLGSLYISLMIFGAFCNNVEFYRTVCGMLFYYMVVCILL
jgi:hypothetical protein